MSQSPIQESVDRLTKAMQAGSGKAYDELYEFVRGMIRDSVNSWPVHIGTLSGDFITSHPEFFTSPHEVVRLARRLNWEIFCATLAPRHSVGLRELLCGLMDRFGKPYIAAMSKSIADVMATIEDGMSTERPHREAVHSIHDPL